MTGPAPVPPPPARGGPAQLLDRLRALTTGPARPSGAGRSPAAGSLPPAPDPDGSPAGSRAGGAAEPRTFTPDFLTELFRNPLDPGYADAAARRARGAGPTGSARHVMSAVSALTLVAVGFLFVLAYRQTVADEPARTRAHNTLVSQVQERRDETVRLQDRADRLRAEVAVLRQRELGGAAVAELENLEAAAGLAPVRGSGAEIRLGDGPTPIDPVTGDRNTQARVKDTDLQLAANALWAGGAEAIAVNGQRLTATSTIRQAGEAILVDFRPVTTPYQVVALGPDSLADEVRDGYTGRFFRTLSDRYGLSFEVGEVDDVQLEAAGDLTLRVARPSLAPSPSASGPAVSAGPGGTPDPSAPAGSRTEPSPTPSEGG